MSTQTSLSRSGFSVLPRFTAERHSRRTTDGDLAIIVAGLAAAAVLGTHLVNFGFDDLRIRVLDANLDSSWSHLCVAATIVASTAMVIVGAARQRGSRGPWSSAAAILAFLSVSEISSLHTQIDSMAWGKLLYTPILLGLGWCLWRLSAGRVARVTILAGVATLIVSFAIHVLGPHIVHALGWGYNSWAFQIKVALKQSTEFAGWLLVACGLGRIVLLRVQPEAGPSIQA